MLTLFEKYVILGYGKLAKLAKTGKLANNILSKIITKRHNMKNKVYFQFSIIILFRSIMVHQHVAPPKITKLSCTNSSLLCFLIRESNTFLLNNSTIFDRSFENSIAFSIVSCFSDSQLHLSYISITIFEYLNHTCHDGLQNASTHPAIPKQYHHH